MRLKLFRRPHQKVDAFCEGRRRQSDAEFVRDCGMDGNEAGARVAVAVRRAVARVGLVDPAFVFAPDRYPHDLGALPLWDSMDWVDLIMRLEDELGVAIPDRVAERLIDVRGFTIRQFVEGVYANVPGVGPVEAAQPTQRS